MRERGGVGRHARDRAAHGAQVDHHLATGRHGVDGPRRAVGPELVGEPRPGHHPEALEPERPQHGRVRHLRHALQERRRHVADLTDQALAVRGVPRVHQQRHDHRTPVQLGREERHWRRHHDVDHRGQLVGGLAQVPDERREQSRVRLEEEHALGDRRHLVQPEAQLGHHPEAAAATAQRPEQVRLVLVVHHQEPSVSRDDVRAEQVVDRQAVPPAEEADATPERQAGDAHGAGVAEPGRQAVLRGDGRVAPRRHAAPGTSGAGVGVDVHRIQAAQVEDHPAVDQRASRVRVAARPDRHREPGLGGQGEDLRHLRGVARPHDDGGCDLPRVEGDQRPGVEARSRGRHPSGGERGEGGEQSVGVRHRAILWRMRRVGHRISPRARPRP